jgi:toxin ParE1/3/4
MSIEKGGQFEADFAAAVLYLADQDFSVATRLIDAVDAAIAMLAKHPEMGPVWRYSKLEKPVRFLLVPGFRNYLIFYRVENDGVRLGRLLHGALDLQNILDER